MPFGSLFSQRLSGHEAPSEFEGAVVHRGRALELISKGELEQAVAELTCALRDTNTDLEGDLLLTRSGAFSSLSEQVRNIPAAHSESHALYGLDPTQLAQLALRDANRAVPLQPKQPEAFLMQGKALLLLERYVEAESALFDGLALDPTHTALQTALRLVSDQSADTRRLSSQRSSASLRAPAVAFSEELECTLCMKMFWEPVTTPCGHTFCRPCFLRAQDHYSRCPMCRTVLHTSRDMPVTITLKNILEKSFPQEYAARGLEEAETTAGPQSAEVQEEAPVPLFVMSCLLPGERMALNIFEPRYRLMVRRCMEGSRRFGMATVRGPHHQLDAVACLAEIIECNPLPDGRYYVEIMGRQRFRIQQAWEQDGYRIARPTYFMDAAPASTEEEHALVRQTSSVESLADQWIQRLRAMSLTSSRDRGILQLLAAASDKPQARSSTSAKPSHAEAMSFWAACILPLDSTKRHSLVEMTSTPERLHMLQGLLQAHNDRGCAIQ